MQLGQDVSTPVYELVRDQTRHLSTFNTTTCWGVIDLQLQAHIA